MELLYEFELEFDEKSIFGKNPEEDLTYLLSEIAKTDETIDLAAVEKAFRFCVDKHSPDFRKSGLKFYTHPLNVALIFLREFTIRDTDSIVACLLHDTIEDNEEVTREMIVEEFSEEVAVIVDAVTKIEALDGAEVLFDLDPVKLKLKIKAQTYRKIFLALVKDIRVILIKLSDRLHNLRTLHYLKPHKQKEIALETLNFYVPLAHRLGLNKVKMELENRSFYYSDRNAYEAIRTSLNEKRRDFIDYIKVFADLIQTSLNEKEIEHYLSIIHKHEYEILKMVQDGKSISDIDNFYSMVIILKSSDVHECYKAHGILANAFNAVSFVDYIANPKMDWYKSLNTEMFGPDGKRVEILIRTEEMEKIAEEGFAAKFSLKSGRIRALEFTDIEIKRWGEWMQDVIEEQGEHAAQAIWDSIKVNLFDSELTVYDKHGESIKLPDGATLIDFAFAIGKEVGLHCISGKVNGLIKELGYKLNSGDQIEIIFSPNAHPGMDWKNFAITHRAVYFLSKYFKEHKKEKIKKNPEVNFEARLKIKGDDRDGMLQDISLAIGMANIRRINLDTTGKYFEGAITIFVENTENLNMIFAKLLVITGIRAVERLEAE